MQKLTPLNGKKYQLSDVLELHSGYPWRGAIKKKENGSIRAVQPKDITELGEINLEHLVVTELAGKRKPDWLKKNDVLLINKGLRNTAAYVEQDLENATCSPSIFLIKPRTEVIGEINMKFIAWQLNQTPVQSYFKRSSEGSLQVSLRRKIIEDTLISLPALQVQNVIAQLYEDSIAEQKALEQLIQNRKMQMSAIAQQLLTSTTP